MPHCLKLGRALPGWDVMSPVIIHSALTRVLLGCGVIALTACSAGCTATGDAVSGDAAPSGPTPGLRGAIVFDLSHEEAPREGPNRFRLALDEAGGTAPLDGANVSLQVVMPSMGHQTTSPDVIDLGSGNYVLPNVVFDMPGDWSLRIRVKKGAVVDELEFPFEIP